MMRMQMKSWERWVIMKKSERIIMLGIRKWAVPSPRLLALENDFDADPSLHRSQWSITTSSQSHSKTQTITVSCLSSPFASFLSAFLNSHSIARLRDGEILPSSRTRFRTPRIRCTFLLFPILPLPKRRNRYRFLPPLELHGSLSFRFESTGRTLGGSESWIKTIGGEIGVFVERGGEGGIRGNAGMEEGWEVDRGSW